MSKAGRPTFSISTHRLHELRKQAKLTQKALAEAVFGLASMKSAGADPRTATNSYQRIERTGKTSERTARLIAEMLAKKLVEDPEKIFSQLCGGQPEPPPDRIDEIEKQLRAQLDGGGSPLLRNAMARHDDAPSPVRELAAEISSRLEVAQLEQRSEELKSLAELTGWTPAELQRPISMEGYWLLITNTMGHRETQILFGVSEVLYQVRTEGSKWLGALQESDVRVELSDDMPWMRALLVHPSHSSRTKEFSFVRCAPGARGLQWVRPSEWDRWKIEGPFGLFGWALQHANFVKDFHAKASSPGNLSELRLLVQRFVNPVDLQAVQSNDRWKTIAVHKGCLNVYPEQIRDNFRAEGSEHALVTNWLASGLWEEVLSLHLGQLPPDWWEITAVESGVQIRSKLVTLHAAARYGLEPEGLTYLIRLVEEGVLGALEKTPWREQCRAELVTRLQKDLDACKRQAAIGPQRPAWLLEA